LRASPRFHPIYYPSFSSIRWHYPNTAAGRRCSRRVPGYD
jgi:hypothetical protein